MSNVKIRDVRAICTAPRNIDLVVVKIETTEPGLYGLGCATFTQRWWSVAETVDKYMKPLLVGRSVDNIEDIWQVMMGSSYWRNGPVLNNAISGVDEALWDIKGKMANMPVYDLLGGKVREGVDVYRHAGGRTIDEVEENVQKFLDEGYRYVRVQLGGYGGDPSKQNIVKPNGAPDGTYFNPKSYVDAQVEMFKHIDEDFKGKNVMFLHDIHERLPGNMAVRMAKDLEPYNLFFLEDALCPEQPEWFAKIREQCTTPLAMGELFNHPLEWRDLVTNRLIDYIRVHISQIGGLSPANKLAKFCEVFGVKTAWHGPGDLSPVGMAAQVHLDLISPNFGIQVFSGHPEVEQEVFPGCPYTDDKGYLYVNDKPGLGVDLDEELAKKYPCEMRHESRRWLLSRLPDGTSVRS